MPKTPLFCKEREYISKYSNSMCEQQNTVLSASTSPKGPQGWWGGSCRSPQGGGESY